MNEAMRSAAFGMAQAKEQRIKDAVATYVFSQPITVQVLKPRWMPNAIYRWLWRTVLVVEGPLGVRDATK